MAKATKEANRTWRLELSLSAYGLDPELLPATSFALIRGGPPALLGWLETQLGLQSKPTVDTSRILQYAARLEETKLELCADSLKIDRWGTARALLKRRDHLRLSGWDGKPKKGIPPLALDLARAESAGSPLHLGIAERVENVLAALDAGQILPPLEAVLREPLAAWPPTWRPVLKRLAATEIPRLLNPQGAKGSALANAQAALANGVKAEPLDGSLLWWSSASDVVAVEAVANGLETIGKNLSGVAVLCEDPALIALLDARLRRRGLPSVGAAITSSAHPVLQVLPLALGICWRPVDPGILLDFLTLPVNPIPLPSARALAEAVSKQPGIGGRMWNLAVQRYSSAEKDPDDRFKKRLADWLTPHVDRAAGMTKQQLKARCSLIARWAQGLAAKLEESEPASVLLDPLKTLAAQAAALADMAESLPGSVAEIQVSKLVASVQESGATITSRQPSAGGPRWISRLSELWEPCQTLIWLGARTNEEPGSPWTAHELKMLEAAGIEAAHGEKLLAACREGEREGFCNIAERAVIIELAAHREHRIHPIWLQARRGVADLKPRRLEELIHKGEKTAFALSTTEFTPQAAKPKPLIWSVPAGSISDRDRVSAGELEARLGCPLQWTLSYPANLKESQIARLPREMQLKGLFSHRVLEVVFGDAESPRDAADVERRVKAACAQLFPTEAAPFAQPGAARERHELETELVRAAHVFFQAVARGGYKVIGFEYEPSGTLLGKAFIGRLDCLLEGQGGKRAVLDLKYLGSKYRTYLAEGTSTQLAIYAAAAAGDGKGGVTPGTGVGYLIIQKANLITPEKSAIAGADGEQIVRGGDSVENTWSALEKALRAADGWLQSGAIPVRPLQPETERPEGSSLALKFNEREKTFEICRYCSYDKLCGRTELV